MPPYDASAPVGPRLGRIRKLLVSLAGTTVGLVAYIAQGGNSPEEVGAALVAYVVTNFGVYQARNDQ